MQLIYLICIVKGANKIIPVLKSKTSFMEKPVLIIYTGGTIGMVNDPETGALCPFNFDQIALEVPEIKEFGFLIDSYTLPEIIDSSDLQPGLWKQLCQIILTNYDKYQGFVILHGTRTRWLIRPRP